MRLYKFSIAIISTIFFEAYAANIEIKPWLLKGDEKEIERILIEGEIKTGDSKKIISLAKKNPERFAKAALGGVILNSNGGNVDEAIKISGVLKDTLATTMAFSPYKCLSACFFIFAGSAIRYATPNTIGVHRPFLPSELLKSISPSKTEEVMIKKYGELSNWLAKNNIPQDIIDKSFQRSSQEIYWLDDEDLNKIGTRATWYEEWLIARCPDYPKAEKLFISNPTEQNRESLEKSSQCLHGIEHQYQKASIERMTKEVRDRN